MNQRVFFSKQEQFQFRMQGEIKETVVSIGGVKGSFVRFFKMMCSFLDMAFQEAYS